MRLPLYQVDAFTSRRFGGNPAAVCLLNEWLPDEMLQAIATENNLSETAYVRKDGEHYALRWFTPACEVDLCGHATLATAWVLRKYRDGSDEMRFSTQKVGELVVRADGDKLVLDFPSRPATPIPAIDGLIDALGRPYVALLRASKTMAVFENAATVRTLEPNLDYLSRLPGDGLIVTAPGTDEDFVSRYFAPHVGIAEDPVTGSAHCTLVPYWAERLGKPELFARQISERGGELWCTAMGERVHIAGHCVGYLEGSIEV